MATKRLKELLEARKYSARDNSGMTSEASKGFIEAYANYDYKMLEQEILTRKHTVCLYQIYVLSFCFVIF